MNFFKDIMGNNKLTDLTGPDYNYYKLIKSPEDLGMSEDGSSIGNNINGLRSYVDILISFRLKYN